MCVKLHWLLIYHRYIKHIFLYCTSDLLPFFASSRSLPMSVPLPNAPSLQQADLPAELREEDGAAPEDILGSMQTIAKSLKLDPFRDATHKRTPDTKDASNGPF